MSFEHLGRRYDMYVQSDIQRDGISLELMDETDSSHILVLEVFYADVDAKLTLSAYREDIPLELVENVIAKAKLRLPPTEK